MDNVMYESFEEYIFRQLNFGVRIFEVYEAIDRGYRGYIKEVIAARDTLKEMVTRTTVYLALEEFRSEHNLSDLEFFYIIVGLIKTAIRKNKLLSIGVQLSESKKKNIYSLTYQGVLSVWDTFEKDLDTLFVYDQINQLKRKLQPFINENIEIDDDLYEGFVVKNEIDEKFSPEEVQKRLANMAPPKLFCKPAPKKIDRSKMIFAKIDFPKKDYIHRFDPKKSDFRFPLPVRENKCGEIENFIKNSENDGKKYILRVIGEKGLGKKTIVCRAAARLGKSITVIDCKKLFAKEQHWHAALKKILNNNNDKFSILCLSDFDSLIEQSNLNKVHSLLELAQEKFSAVFLTMQKFDKDEFLVNESFSWVDFDVNKLTKAENLKFWDFYLEKFKHLFSSEIRSSIVSNSFVFTPLQIKETMETADSLLKKQPKLEKINKKNLYKCAMEQSISKLSDFAKVVEKNYSFDDLVLDAETDLLLRNKCSRIRFTERFLGKRENPGERGHKVLLYGQPGTGKTMCAIAMAELLDYELFRVDSASITSKWVGETKKNLRKMFEEAEKCHNTILLIDECDGLFSKRGDSENSSNSNNDNVGYLLQLIEEFRGILILTTNLISNVDPAFKRRVFSISISKPDDKDRVRVWQKCLEKTGIPLDSNIDYEYLTKSFTEFSPALINKIVFTSAFNAVRNEFYESQKYRIARKSKINIGHIIHAISEITNCTQSCFDRYSYLLAEPEKDYNLYGLRV